MNHYLNNKSPLSHDSSTVLSHRTVALDPPNWKQSRQDGKRVPDQVQPASTSGREPLGTVEENCRIRITKSKPTIPTLCTAHSHTHTLTYNTPVHTPYLHLLVEMNCTQQHCWDPSSLCLFCLHPLGVWFVAGPADLETGLMFGVAGCSWILLEVTHNDQDTILCAWSYSYCRSPPEADNPTYIPSFSYPAPLSSATDIQHCRANVRSVQP